MRCASCGFENPEGLRFCGKCGTILSPLCPQCGFDNPLGFAFCGQCGTPLSAQPARKRKPKPAQQTAKRDKRSRAKPQFPKAPRPPSPEAERRQLTVLFCDLVGSTALSAQLDPEELREVERAYQRLCAAVIDRFEGHLAKYIGDGLLVYFGYPVAHEDDAQRAVRAGLEITGAITELPLPPYIRLQQPLQVRIGIHTGLVVAGEMGTADQPEHLAIVGETPNLAARLQEKAAPNTVLISAATYRLIEGYFTCCDLGLVDVKGMPDPVQVYQVVEESGVHSRLEVAATKGLTPLIGREEDLALLRRHWARAKEGGGQAVLLSGEPGIGKSRLAQALKEHVIQEGATWLEFHCSPYFQNTAWYPIIEHLHRVLQFDRTDAPQTKLAKLQRTLAQYHFPQADTVPLLAALLSLPYPEGCPPLTLSPQKQKQRTQEALVAWIVEEAERNVVSCTWEDLHWADPSTLEILQLYLDQVPTTRLLALLTFRPEFRPPWAMRSHMSQITLSRLSRTQIEEMVEKVTGGKALPTEVVQQIVAKTDGVPLFVEELTKMVVESVGTPHASPLLPLAIPATLQDSLMARLDRLGSAKAVAQLGATLGREFSYELLQAVSSLDEAMLQQELAQLVDAEFLFQRGLSPQARYIFKHALIQDAAYQSLLKSMRQQYHQQIAQVLEERFPETKETQPELIAHHYTAVGLIAEAIPYWKRAGENASRRSAYAEAINLFTRGLELLKTLPDTPEHTQQELTLQMTLGAVLHITKGFGVSEVGKAYARARELCQKLGESPQLFSVLQGLWAFYFARAEHKTARELGEQCLTLAQRTQSSAHFLWAHFTLGSSLLYLGEFASARAHQEQGIALYDPQKRSSGRVVQDHGVAFLSESAWALWLLGYPEQALKRIHAALTLARELSHPYSLAWVLNFAAGVHYWRREKQLVQEQAEALIALSNEKGFRTLLATGTVRRGWALAMEGQAEEGIAQIHQGLAAFRATGTEIGQPGLLVLLAEAYGKVRKTEEGLSVLTEALALVDSTGERAHEAELYRLKGTLTLQAKIHGPTSTVEAEAEECFHKAITIARQQQAKSLELRAVMSLSRLWQHQGKRAEARQLLADIYGWFTEGFDTKDLQEAKALLKELH
jgi:class 3 adenylate cyclase/predicted ATPase